MGSIGCYPEMNPSSFVRNNRVRICGNSENCCNCKHAYTNQYMDGYFECMFVSTIGCHCMYGNRLTCDLFLSNDSYKSLQGFKYPWALATKEERRSWIRHSARVAFARWYSKMT